MMIDHELDPNLDLVLERTVDVSPKLVWRAWTEPEQLKKWFAPKPWTTVDAQIVLRPGGIFRTVMKSPEGQEVGGDGCILEVVEEKRLSWTDALAPGFRPTDGGFFTAVLTLTPKGSGTLYRAVAKHADPTAKSKHEDMGFAEGWGKCLDQLVEIAKQM